MNADARSAGMGSSFAVLSGNRIFVSNPAGLAALNSPTFALMYGNFYGIKELSTGAFSCGIPTKSGTFGFGFVASGFAAITENKATLSFGKAIGKNLRAGIGINWLNFNQPSDYQDLYAWIPALGIQWLGEKWIAGLSVINPAAQEYNPKGYRNIPACIVTGLGFKPSDEFFMLFEAQKISNEKIRYVLGIETSLLKSLFLRFGITRQDYSSYSAGAGYVKRNLIFDAAVSHHPALGFSPAFTFNFAF
ncbi:MAG TPA: hypothetical protein VHI78_04530 [Bacteroidales bacterium]|jgi:hypothetical protein|nr:hypothetical protein [Bacteroidales bacterium]